MSLATRLEDKPGTAYFVAPFAGWRLPFEQNSHTKGQQTLVIGQQITVLKAFRRWRISYLIKACGFAPSDRLRHSNAKTFVLR